MTDSQFTPIPQMQAEVARLRAAFDSGRTRPLEWRRAQLQAILRLLKEREGDIIAAIHADLRKGRLESWMAEIALIRTEAKHALRHLKSWTARRRVRTPIAAQPGRSWVQPEPLGVVLCIASWNFPWQQTLQPMVGALAAGNCVLVKPSELSSHCAAAIARLLPEYLDPEAVAVVQGGPEETGALLECRFDHILYTGGASVGRIVMRAAAQHLTPVTLEMGGKCPVIVDRTADIALAARRIVWAKGQNAGQICINADYVLVHRDRAAALTGALAAEFRRAYGADPQMSKDYGRIVNERHFDRLQALLSQGRIVQGGRTDRGDLYIEPTIVADVPGDAPLMQDEIFGPILPIVEWQDEDDLAMQLKAHGKPLALYVFSRDQGFQDRALDRFPAGMVAINDLMMFAIVPGLPFGGVGGSGMGAYGGQQGFRCFSHMKPVLRRGSRMDIAARYAPYSGLKERIMRLALR
ncbi:aldehyde dehydrogenase family protein [Paracoccus sp. 1_MG-2023]|uniref:aldehyde dehydrogenase family protein n=1 Tax=unclassified Paracoccus (in: a-proteobacteria) TaxID=2688777 RepID=UPI001C080258|nr:MULTISPECIES: aldehyde dehydrogenase family protein [unclassified Paracoccus (in: a-proteobacteria)]MBU2956077.1 aldehyde dehydrogenase family protein [Paracoccus sp. C2R09]MDO6669483.1 aldehyde dehydrogenase family protein [Paracoccus sp. 1_MG-2023]